jgi:hypothetical protein
MRRSPSVLNVSPLPALGPSRTVTSTRSLLTFAQSTTGRVEVVPVVPVVLVLVVDDEVVVDEPVVVVDVTGVVSTFDEQAKRNTVTNKLIL